MSTTQHIERTSNKTTKKQPARESTSEADIQRVRTYITSLATQAKKRGEPVEVDIGPDLAFERFLLTINPENNRKLYRDHLAKACRFLQSGGSFYARSQTIVINWDVMLETGQHRAHAAVKTGIPSKHRLVVGVEPGSEYSKDHSKPLIPVDEWHRNGFKNGVRRRAIINMILCDEAQVLSFPADDIITRKGEELNGTDIFEAAVSYGMCCKEICNQAPSGFAYWKILSHTCDTALAAHCLNEVWGGTRVRARKKAVSSLLIRLEKLQGLQRSGEKAFRGMKGNFHIASAFILFHNSLPSAAPSLAWDGDTLTPKVTR